MAVINEIGWGLTDKQIRPLLDQGGSFTFEGEALLKGFPTDVYDEEGFFKGFSLDQPAEIKAFFDLWGFVVVDGVIPAPECDAAVAEFWATTNPPITPDDPSTWDVFWSRQQFGKLGIIGSMSTFRPCLLAMRQHPRLHAAFSAVFSDHRLLVDHDRLGVMRPTELPAAAAAGPSGSQSGATGSRPDWKTLSGWLHIDCNPASGQLNIGSLQRKEEASDARLDFVARLYVQGLVALSDAREQDGGFHCVPGSPRLVEVYRRIGSPSRAAENLRVPSTLHPVWQYVKKIAVRKGAVVVWNSLTLHGNHPNASDRFRIVHYLRMLPSSSEFESIIPALIDRHPEIQDGLTELGKKLFGLEPW